MGNQLIYLPIKSIQTNGHSLISLPINSNRSCVFQCFGNTSVNGTDPKEKEKEKEKYLEK
jgi:hypothetical protein